MVAHLVGRYVFFKPVCGEDIESSSREGQREGGREGRRGTPTEACLLKGLRSYPAEELPGIVGLGYHKTIPSSWVPHNDTQPMGAS